MTCYLISNSEATATPLNRYQYKSEGSDLISPQTIIQKNPEIVLNELDLGFQDDNTILVCREFGTSRGSIDILIITKTADIIIIETKLFKNSDSHRTVVAQVIDYAKALSCISAGDLLISLSKNQYVNKEVLSKLRNDDYWLSSLEANLKTGNFQIVVLGDLIHPNILGMVESIQSAPHLAFTINLLELDSYIADTGQIIIHPKTVSKTIEIERSVIRISIDHNKQTHTIDSEIPEPNGKGQRPVLNEEQYLNSLTKPDFAELIRQFWNHWCDIGGDIKFCPASFSAGINCGDKRIPLFYGYRNATPVISESSKNYNSIPEDLYNTYKNDLKPSKAIYDGYVIGNKVDVPFEIMTKDDLKLMMDASIKLAKSIMNSSE
jgi:hypothetical protein